jgi:hypothetical protein
MKMENKRPWQKLKRSSAPRVLRRLGKGFATLGGQFIRNQQEPHRAVDSSSEFVEMLIQACLEGDDRHLLGDTLSMVAMQPRSGLVSSI